jgi:hypothetical protein
MARADDLRDCLGEVLGSAVPEVPNNSGDPLRFYRQWLAERNLGLVPIAEPVSFDWAGQWMAIVEGHDGQHAVVMFGSPSGVWLDPSGMYQRGQITAGWILTRLDLHLPRPARRHSLRRHDLGRRRDFGPFDVSERRTLYCSEACRKRLTRAA